jgi:wyosine [tRNA(Phe)-imidazoG37] synthetase (radical SAM superfamily)
MNKNEAKYKYIYGPVPSRRLGRSLGVDLLPFKVCSYDCIYCQLGRTKQKTVLRKEYVPTSEVIEEIRRKIHENCEMDFISFAGSGEPTLHSGLKEIILSIKEMTKIPVAVLTNGSLLYLEEVSDALMNADVVIPSLDAGTRTGFLKVNRPCPSIDFEKMCEGIVEFSKNFTGKVWLEVMVVKGYNDRDEEIAKIASFVNRMKVDKIQLNTVVRPPAERFAEPASEDELLRLKKYFQGEVEVIGTVKKALEAPSNVQQKDLEDRILALIRRRPVTLEDIGIGLSLRNAEVAKAVTNLLGKKMIRVQLKGGKSYYIEDDERRKKSR